MLSYSTTEAQFSGNETFQLCGQDAITKIVFLWPKKVGKVSGKIVQDYPCLTRKQRKVAS